MTKPKSLHIEGRRWFQRSTGNTYHTARIFLDGELVHTTDKAYGYDEGYLQSAIDWLKASGHVPESMPYGTYYLREVLGGTYSVINVQREKDL